MLLSANFITDMNSTLETETGALAKVNCAEDFKRLSKLIRWYNAQISEMKLVPKTINGEPTQDFIIPAALARFINPLVIGDGAYPRESQVYSIPFFSDTGDVDPSKFASEDFGNAIEHIRRKMRVEVPSVKLNASSPVITIGEVAKTPTRIVWWDKAKSKGYVLEGFDYRKPFYVINMAYFASPYGVDSGMMETFKLSNIQKIVMQEFARGEVLVKADSNS